MSARPGLLFVDVQLDYLQHPKLTPGADALEATLVGLLRAARGAGWPVFHVQTRVSADLNDAMPHWRDAAHALCVVGSPGARPPPALAPLPGEAVIHKRFYSAFEDGSLSPALRAAGVDTLIVAGVHTHACVRAAVTDAYAEGFTVLVPREGVASYDPDHAAVTLDWLDGRAARCLPIAELLPLLDTTTSPPSAVWRHRDPTDGGRLLSETPLAREAEVGAAIAAVRARRIAWRDVRASERAARLAAWRALLVKQRAQWVEALIREVGKPRIDAEGEVGYGLALLETVHDQLLAHDPPGRGRARHRPHGVVALITPWNNPFAIPISKIAPALGYGNGVVWKPAAPASGLARALFDSLSAVGLDEAALLVTGDGITGELLARAGGIDAISFTGSVAVGRRLARLCGGLMRPLQAELGGNNAAIVLRDADLDAAARDLAIAMFSFAGQRCTAIRRVIVERPIVGRFTALLCEAVAALKVGPPADPATRVGPVISKARQAALLATIAQAVESGGRVLTGGAAPADCPPQGAWISPTVMTDLPSDSPVLTDELFGPVVALSPAEDLSAALRQHSQYEYGLLGALYSNDKASQARFLAEAQAGLLALNQARPAFASEGPFVGWKASGYGVPEHGRWNRDFYTKVQAVYGAD